ncbi:MAG TPA: HPF/RaiA family ribosome-associated protein [Longimicrobiales bacterium]|nr:HPF/RaiA family ribosome-associated protein [Longimicrobiales bacterium]
MDITMNARHCSVPESIRKQAQARLERLQRFEPRMLGATVTYLAENGVKQVDIRAVIKGGPPQVGHGAGPTFRYALDRAMDRMERQVKRRRDRRRTYRTRSTAPVEAPISA